MWARPLVELMLLSFILPAVSEDMKLKEGMDGLLGATVFLGMFLGSVALRCPFSSIACTPLTPISVPIGGVSKHAETRTWAGQHRL